jgi:hypothetical protein
MSTITLVIIVLSVLATVFFVAGYARGLMNAINGYHAPEEPEEVAPQNGHWKGISLALAMSILVIAGMGYSTFFVYLGPVLVLITTVGVGVAFFIEKKTPAPTR